MADACPMGCGGVTEDVYGGPCQSCWDAVPADPCPICGDDLALVDREGHMWDEHGDEHHAPDVPVQDVVAAHPEAFPFTTIARSRAQSPLALDDHGASAEDQNHAPTEGRS
jgi:hypothetical protein